MTVQEAVLCGTGMLEEAAVPDPGNDARQLMLYLLGISLSGYISRIFETLEKTDEDAYFSLIRRRMQRVPLQHITGKADFYGFEFEVNSHVLIPRYDTETLVDAVLRDDHLTEGKDPGAMRLLDLCTGSGCIATVLKKLGGFGLVMASDIDPEALRIAKRNAQRLNAKVEFCRGDLFDALPENQKEFDIIVSNPPYIAESEREDLQPEVRLFDPEIALFAPENGLYFYRRITEEAPEHLCAGGKLFFEIGASQASDVEKLLIQHGFTEIRVFRDLAGMERVITGKKA